MQKSSYDTKQYIELLEQKVLKFREKLNWYKQRDLEQQARIVELEKKLAYYENPHTPPSVEKLSYRKNQDEGKSDHVMKKRGAPKGHKGATRPKPEPDETIDVIADECERCGSQNLQDLNEVEKNVVEDLPPPQKIKVTQFIRHKVKCLNCGHEFISKHPDCPKVGKFGVFLLVYITMLKFHLRGVLQKIQDFLFYENDFEISTKGVHDVLLRVGDVCKISYEKNLERIRNARWVHIDETGIKVNGKKYWLWIFRTDKNDILVVIRKSRGGKVPEEILGADWDKPIVVDGWKAYWKYLIIQRCWAHLIREIDEFKDVSDKGKELSEIIHLCFDNLKVFLEKNPSMSERRKQKQVFDQQMADIVEKYSKYKELYKPTKYLMNGLGKWYTCLLYPGMEPTNNLGEQAMREHVIMRKIIGCFRSKRGAENYQYIASLLATWKLQNMNIFEELEDVLRKQLCMS